MEGLHMWWNMIRDKKSSGEWDDKKNILLFLKKNGLDNIFKQSFIAYPKHEYSPIESYTDSNDYFITEQGVLIEVYFNIELPFIDDISHLNGIAETGIWCSNGSIEHQYFIPFHTINCMRIHYFKRSSSMGVCSLSSEVDGYFYGLFPK